MSRKLLTIYYAATALFPALDFGFEVNIRAAYVSWVLGLKSLRPE